MAELWPSLTGLHLNRTPKSETEHDSTTLTRSWQHAKKQRKAPAPHQHVLCRDERRVHGDATQVGRADRDPMYGGEY
eukprot:594721-Amphidinium_carterae.1